MHNDSYNKYNIIKKKNIIVRIVQKDLRKNWELRVRMHPWLAGAWYRTTAVVLVYRLISLIGPHCPASTYSSTCSSLSMHFSCAQLRKRRKKKRKKWEEKKRIKLRVLIGTHDRRCSTIGALFTKYLSAYQAHSIRCAEKFVFYFFSFFFHKKITLCLLVHIIPPDSVYNYSSAKMSLVYTVMKIFLSKPPYKFVCRCISVVSLLFVSRWYVVFTVLKTFLYLTRYNAQSSTMNELHSSSYCSLMNP